MNRTTQIVWTVVFCLIILILYQGHLIKNETLANRGFTTGKITFIDYKGSYKGTNIIYFDCIIDGISYKENFTNPNTMYKFADTLIGVSFPVIYNKTNHKHSEALLYEYQYQRFDLIQPDSLKWVNKYFGE
jgi:hypothetical protein